MKQEPWRVTAGTPVLQDAEKSNAAAFGALAGLLHGL